MAAKPNPAYFQHHSNGSPKGHMVATVNPAYFLPGHGSHGSVVHGRKGSAGRSKHGRSGMHGRPHDTMRSSVRDPWHRKGQGRNKR